MKLIPIIGIIQMMFSPWVMYFTRKYIQDNISHTIEKFPSRYTRAARKEYPKEIYAVLKDGTEILYDTPTIVVSIQIFIGFICLLII